MVGMSKSYQRYQMQNIPSDTWLMEHTAQRSTYMDVRIAYIFDGLDYDRILRLVVGNRWSVLHPQHWPLRIRQRTKALTGEELDIRENERIDVGLSKVRDWWTRKGQYLQPNALVRLRMKQEGWL